MVSNNNEVQAFLLVIAAGLCTMIGASVVFFPSLANLAKPNILATALGFAAGIMIYISLIDIWGKSAEAYEKFGHEEEDAFIYATLTFFCGCVLMLGLDVLVDKLLAWDNKRNSVGSSTNDTSIIRTSVIGSTVKDINTFNKMREDFVENKFVENKVESKRAAEAFKITSPESSVTQSEDQSKHMLREPLVNCDNKLQEEMDLDDDGRENNKAIIVDTTQGENRDQLNHMGWAMAAAIAIHNFPEGMVTYLAYTQEPSVGIALAVGIAVHNIPEGLCVAMPLYYATGRRWYSFLWGTLSGLTEPIGALLVWLVLSSGMSGNVDGILFGLVAGMMTVISVDELIPTAHKYATDPKTVTYSLIFGMFFIAVSLMLFQV